MSFFLGPKFATSRRKRRRPRGFPVRRVSGLFRTIRAPRRTRFKNVPSRAFRRGNIRSAGRLKTEVKTRDLNLTTSFTTTLGDMLAGVPINGISQGTANNQRIGNRIITTQLQVVGTLAFNPLDTGSTTAGNFNNIVKVIWGVDHQANGAIITPGDVYDQLSSTASWRNMDHIDRFTILKTMKVARTAPIASSVGGTDEKVGAQVDVPFSFVIPMRMVTRFEGTGATISDISDNHIFCLGIMEDTQCPCTLTQRIRMRYEG